jgi:hypothetical protein
VADGTLRTTEKNAWEAIEAMAAIKVALDPLDEETRAHVLRWIATSLHLGESRDPAAEKP